MSAAPTSPGPVARVRDLLPGGRRQRAAALLAAGVAGVVDELPEGEATVIGAAGIPLAPDAARRLDRARDLAQQGGRLVARGPATTPALPADPALPGLHTLLDPSAMSPLLGTDLPDQPDPPVRVRSVRYRPGRSVVVEYAVATDTGWLTATAFATRTDKARRHATRRRATRAVSYVAGRTPVTTPVGFHEATQSLVTWLPVDLGLPMVGLRTKKLNRRLAEAGIDAVRGAKPRLIRYQARRRAVTRFGPYVLKSYRSRSDYRAAERGLRSGSELPGVRTAGFVAALPERRTTVQYRVKGRAPSFTSDGCAPAGRLLADLHAAPDPGLPSLDADQVLAKVRRRAQHLARLLPDLTDDLDVLVARLSEGCPAGSPLVTSHGNFHAGQLLAGHEGLRVIDLDRMCLAAPAYDVACFVAQFALGSPGEAELLVRVRASLLEGYGEAPKDLDWYLSAALLRRAFAPFRRQVDDWAGASTELVVQAVGALG